jgi:putative addiction module component (TIGR02574 family)
MPATATVQDLEARALALSEPERARLVGTLVRSLTDAGDSIFGSWLDEAERRDREMGEDPNAGAPADEVLRRASARLG